ncbi:MAG: hypothetical protein K6G55_04360 [Selenomonadaceae bacterium]|nr:hypothetical protein [Selenomonadaceae bacterium]
MANTWTVENGKATYAEEDTTQIELSGVSSAVSASGVNLVVGGGATEVNTAYLTEKGYTLSSGTYYINSAINLGSNTLTISSGATLYILNVANITATENYVVALNNEGTVNISGGSVTGGYGGKALSNSGVANISGGEFTATGSYSYALYNSGTVNVYADDTNGTNAKATFSGTVDGTINYGTSFTINDTTMTYDQFNSYVAEQTSVTTTVAGISEGVLNIYDNALFGSESAVTVNNNNGSYAFNVDSDVTGSFYGTSGVDNITVNGAAYINGMSGNDFITVTGNSAMIDVSVGDDVINVSGATSFSVTGFGAGNSITGLTGDISTIEGGIMVGNTSIYGVSAAVISGNWNVNTDKATATYQLFSQSGATLQNGTLVYQNASVGSALVELAGVNSTVGLGIKDGYVVTFGSGSYVDGGVTVQSNDAGYRFNIGSDFGGNAFYGMSTTDFIVNNAASVAIYGMSGDDIVTNKGANAYIDGGVGADFIYSTGDSATINGGVGADIIYNEGANASIYGGDGNDTIENYGASATIMGGDGADYIENEGNSAYINGGEGNDTVMLYSGMGTTVNVSEGDDLISVNSANVTSFAVEGFGEGDSITGLTGTSIASITGGINVGGVSIYGVSAAIVDGNWNVDTDKATASYQLSGQSGVTFNDDGILVYQNASVGSALVELAGVTDTVGLDVDDETIILGAGSYEESGVTVQSNKDNYAFSLSSAFDGNAFYGMSGADLIYNYAASVAIYGMSGADNIWNEGANATIDGGKGDDIIQNYEAESVAIYGGDGDDFIDNTGGNYATINGGDGADNILNGGNYATINGGDGDDLIANKGNSAYIDGGDDNDTVQLYSGTGTTVNVGSGSDLISVNSDSITSFWVEGFGEGDSITGLTGTSIASITGGIEVGGVSIYGVSAAIINTGWNVNEGTASYQLSGQSGVDFNDDGTLVYATVPSDVTDLLTLGGVSSAVKADGDNLVVAGVPEGATAVTADYLSTNNYTLESGTYYINSTINLGSKTLTINEGATLYILDDASISSSEQTIRNLGTVKITGGTIKTTSGERIALNNEGGTAYISGGTFSATSGTESSVALWNWESGTVYISDGTFSGSRGGVNNKEGTVNISGGTFSGNIYSLQNTDTVNVYSDGTAQYSQISGTITKVDTVTIDGEDKDVTAFNSYVSEQTNVIITVAGISDTVLNIYDNALFGSASSVTVNYNGGSYAFNIGESVTGSFYGTSGIDNITVNGAAYINGMSGNDFITVAGNSAMIDVSVDDDVINVSGASSFSVTGFEIGDSITGLSGTITEITGGIAVGTTSIYGISAAIVDGNKWNVNTIGGTASYQLFSQSGVTLNAEGTLVYATVSSDVTDLLTLSGVSSTVSANGDNLVVDITKVATEITAKYLSVNGNELTSGIYYINSTINLGNKTLTIPKGATLYILNGANITSTGDYALNNSGTLNISGGTVSGNTALLNWGTANITGGTFSGNVALDNNGTANISGGTFTGTYPLNNDGTANISGGNFTGQYYAVLNYGTVNVYEKGTGWMGIYGSGTRNYGTSFTINDTTMTYEQFKSYVAEQTSVTTTVAGISGTVLNIYDNALFGSESAVTVNYNGGSYAFNIGEEYTGGFYGTSGIDEITVNGAAYINGLSGNDFINVAGDSAIVDVSVGDDVINVSGASSFSVTGFGVGDSITGLSGAITEITGGINVGGVSIYGVSAAVINGNWNVDTLNATATYQLSGQSGASMQADGTIVYETVSSDATNVLTLGGVSSAISKNGDNLVVGGMPEGATEITQDNFESTTLGSGKTYYINSAISLGSYTLTINEGATLYILNEADITFEEGGYPALENHGTVYISGGTITATGIDGQALWNYGTVNISGGSFYATGTGATALVNGDSQNKAIANISGGEFYTKEGDCNALHNNKNGTVNISGGSFTATNGSALYNPGGTANISGGEFSGNTALKNESSGLVNVYKGNTAKFSEDVSSKVTEVEEVTIGGKKYDLEAFNKYVEEQTSGGGGTTTVAGISNGVLNIYSDALFGSESAVTVNYNGGSYAFNIGEEYTGGFYGTSGVDTITVNGAAYINGLSGNDIINVAGDSAMIDVSLGDDLINVSGASSFSVTGFGAGDSITGLSGTITEITGGIEVGGVSIYGVSAAVINTGWNVDTDEGTASYQLSGQSGATMQADNTIVYATVPSDVTDLLTLGGVSSAVKADGDNLVVAGVPEGATEVTADYLSTNEYTLSDGTYYIDSTIALGENTLTINEGATLYILNGANITATGTDAALKNYGTVNISGGTFTSTNGTAICGSGTINISGGKINVTGQYGGTAIYGGSIINISGGTLSAETNVIIHWSTINISGGEFTVTKENGNVLNNWGTANISGGTFTAPGENGYALINGGTANVYSTTNDSTGAYATFNGSVSGNYTPNYGTTFNDMNYNAFKSYVAEQTKGTTTVAGISGTVLNIYDNAIFGSESAVTVNYNGGSYAFNIGESVTGSFYGTSGVDNITVGGAAYINGLSGNDFITVAGDSAMIDVSEGDDLINVSGASSFSVTGFDIGDSITGVSGTITEIEGGINVGGVSIYGVSMAIINANAWTVDTTNNTATYQLINESGATMQADNTIVYATVSGETKDLLELDGVSTDVKADGDNLVVAGGTTTVAGIGKGLLNIYDNAIFGSDNSISVNNNDGSYAFNIGESVTGSFYGTDDADTITNSGTGTTINGGDGNDIIFNSGVSATVLGGEGADNIVNTGAFASINGGEGSDTITNVGDNVMVDGGDGNDYINNYVANVLIEGGSGNDTINNSGTSSTINGGEGNDIIFNSGVSATVLGGEGADNIVNTGAFASINGGEGSDTITNVGDNVSIEGGAGVDYINNEGANVLIEGGADNDSIFNGGASTVILGGDGDDTIENAGEGSIVDGGAGDDIINNYGSNATIYGGAGSNLINLNGGNNATVNVSLGSDIINVNGVTSFTVENFADNDTISGVSGTISTIEGGIAVGDTSIYGINAIASSNDFYSEISDTSFAYVVDYEAGVTLNGNQLVMSDYPDTIETLFTVNGLSIGATEFMTIEGTTVIVGASAIEGITEGVTISGEDYTFKFADDVKTEGETIAPEWKLNDNVASYMTGASGAHFALDSGSTIINYIEQIGGTSSVEIAGVNSTDGLKISDDYVILGEGSYADSGVTVQSNDGGYAFSLGSDFNGGAIHGVTGADTVENNAASVTIYGADTEDSITNNAEDVTIYGLEGDDEITNNGDNAYIDGGEDSNIINLNGGDNATVNVGSGSDIINVEGVSSFTVENFVDDTITGVSGDITSIEGGIEVGGVSIYGISAIATNDKYFDEAGSSSISYIEKHESGIMFKGNQLVMGGTDTVNTLFTISGLNIGASKSITVDGTTVILGASALEGITESVVLNGEGYTFALSGVATEAGAAEGEWELEEKTAVYNGGGFGAYYDLSSDKTSVTYVPEIGNEPQFTITGIANTTGMTPEDGVITLSEENYEGDGVTIMGGGSSFTLNNTADNKQIIGSTETDNIINEGAKATIDGGEGSDNITNTGEDVYVDGGKGSDTIISSGAGSTVDGGTGNNDIYLKNSDSEDGTTVILGEGSRNTVHGFNDGFDGDIVQVNDLDNLEYSFSRGNLKFDSGTSRIKFDDAMQKGILLTDGEEEMRALFAQDGDYVEIEKDNLPSDCYGKKSGVDFSPISDTTTVNLGEGIGTVNRKSFKLNGINKAKAGDGFVALIGSDSRNVLTAGNGYTSMSGGKGDDILVGRSDSEDKFGRTTFQFEAGDGHDVIKNFEFLTKDNITTADSISVDGDINSGHLSGNDVVAVLDDDAQITIRDAAGKNIAINGLIAKVDTNLSFDGVANCYVLDGGNSLSVDSSLESAEIWLDNSQDTKFYGDIRTLDASNVSGNTSLVGNDKDNTIIAGQGDASLWGGASASNDVLIGGEGKNTFFYCNGNGNDIIKSTGDDDIVMLSDITLDDLASTGITENTVSINLKERGSLTVEGTTDVTYQLADGSRYTANHSTSEWEAK